MPDLEEFGLGEEGELGSLIEVSGSKARSNPAIDVGNLIHRLKTKQLGTYKDGDGETSHVKIRPGMLRWSFLVGILSLVAVYHMGLESGATKREASPEDWELKDISDDGSDDDSAVEGDVKKNPETATKNDEPDFGLFTTEKLEATRKVGKELMEMLNEYYYGEDQAKRMLTTGWIDDWNFDAPENATSHRERNAKMIDTMARALVTDEQKEFIIGTIGSSVAAGHDNCGYDSYENQLMRTWGPLWKSAGMEFVHQNAGEGGGCGDSYQNQIFCIKQNVSPDIDIVHYEWTYFEGGRASPEHESLIRWIQMLPRQPPLHIYNTGEIKGGGPEVQLNTLYAKYGYNSFYQKTSFIKGGYDYDSEQSRKEDPINRFGWGYIGDGYHNTTRYGELAEDEARQNSLGVVMRNWHPGPMGFQITSDAFAYVYTTALLKALSLIEAEMKEGRDPRLKWSASERPILMKQDLPDPIFCDPEYCVVDEPPECLNYEKPTYGNWGARVEEPDGDLNPHKGEVQDWSVWTADNNLWYMVGKQDTAIFKTREDQEMCRHLDACGGITAKTANHGSVVFRLPKMEVGLLVICGCCGKKVGEEMLLNNPKLEFKYNGELLDKKEFDVWPHAKCIRLLKRFPTQGAMAETPTGHAYLSIKVLEDMAKEVKISHIITL